MGRLIPSATLNVAIAIAAFVVIVPFAIVLSWSFKPHAEIFSLPVSFIPQSPTLSNYTELFTTAGFQLYFPNSIFVAILYTALGLLWCSMGGWGLAHYHTRLNGPIITLLIATIAIPFQVLVIAAFVLVVQLGLINTLWALIIPFSASPYGILFMRQYMLSIPRDLTDAARIDGANEWQIYRSIALPLARPALAALGVLLFLDSWNDFLWPLIALLETSNFTAPLGMAKLVGPFEIKFGQIMAASILMLVPVATVLLLAQRQFVAGITGGALQR